jgi:hypothetical protein
LAGFDSGVDRRLNPPDEPKEVPSMKAGSRGPRHSSPYTELVVDLAQFSIHTGRDQAELRSELAELLDEAAEAAHLQREVWITQDRGDGELALIPAVVPKASLVADLVRELARLLHDRNRKREAAWRMRLRMALHHGEARVQGTGFPGAAAVVACRLVDSQPLRSALDAEPDAPLAVIVSHRMYEDTVAEREGGLEPADWARVEIGRGRDQAGKSCPRCMGHRPGIPQTRAAAGEAQGAQTRPEPGRQRDQAGGQRKRQGCPGDRREPGDRRGRQPPHR